MSNDLHNDVLKNIYARRSIRDYLPDDVPDNIIRELIRAGTYAPSAADKQPWRFVVIKDKELMNKLSDKAKELWMELDAKASNPELIGLAKMVSRPGFNIFFNAPILIMIFSHPDAFSPQIDCALAAENMMLAARSLGIGSCWIGLGAPLGKVQAIMDELGAPAECKLVGCLIFGHPAKLDHKAPERDENVILKWIV
ncbi:MAG: nitroreductase [Methanothrix sp.]|nr:nitroreductase [Methanothrix sp.]